MWVTCPSQEMMVRMTMPRSQSHLHKHQDYQLNLDLEEIEEESRRMERKRAPDQVIEESRPKKKRKLKYPRLEAWGESNVVNL